MLLLYLTLAILHRKHLQHQQSHIHNSVPPWNQLLANGMSLRQVYGNLSCFQACNRGLNSNERYELAKIHDDQKHWQVIFPCCLKREVGDIIKPIIPPLLPVLSNAEKFRLSFEQPKCKWTGLLLFEKAVLLEQQLFEKALGSSDCTCTCHRLASMGLGASSMLHIYPFLHIEPFRIFAE